MVQGGKILKYGKNIPFNFLQVFLSQLGKKLDHGGKYLLFLLKLISNLSRKEGTAWPGKNIDTGGKH
jgi:hypothetical protein